MLGWCNEDERSIPDYNPHTDYGLDDFDEDYNGHSGSREGVNDDPAHYDGMESDPSEGGRSGSMPPDGEKDGLVNLYEKTCTCREFQNDLLPCCHALAAIRFCKKNLETSVLISTKQAPGWKAILVSSFPLDTQANGILLRKYVPKLFFHQSGDLKPVGRERKGFHLQASMVLQLGTVPYVRNLGTTDKIVQTPQLISNQMLWTHNQIHNQMLRTNNQIHNRADVVNATHVDKRDTT
ncbi:hypothetical protein LWI29_023554 [Acer saccharum]|uniref:SWIM-type domain-containing protein n=1 Tax=Acer saccharum TaxID=4024 RepID=A0AA39TUN6_ACESA|nr:hypothetical protein LWI29_023554 [Acer saccharum]